MCIKFTILINAVQLKWSVTNREPINMQWRPLVMHWTKVPVCKCRPFSLRCFFYLPAIYATAPAAASLIDIYVAFFSVYTFNTVILAFPCMYISVFQYKLIFIQIVVTYAEKNCDFEPLVITLKGC